MQSYPQAAQPIGKSLSQAKMLGGIGSILTLLLFVPTAGGILVIVGLVLQLLALRDISEAVHDRSILNNGLISVVMGAIGIGAFTLIVAGAILGLIGLGNTYSATGTSPVPSDVFGLIGAIIVGLAVAWVFGIVSSVFLRKSYQSVSAKTGVGTFGTAGTIYLVGSVLEIILVGFLLNFIAQILSIVAYFSLPDYPPQQQMMMPPQSMTPQ